MQFIRYVHNNPVKAKMVEKVQDYKWVRFKEYHQQEDENEYLEIKEDLEKIRSEKAQKII